MNSVITKIIFDLSQKLAAGNIRVCKNRLKYTTPYPEDDNYRDSSKVKIGNSMEFVT